MTMTYTREEAYKLPEEIHQSREIRLLNSLIELHNRIESSIEDLEMQMQNQDWHRKLKNESYDENVGAFVRGIVDSRYEITTYYDGAELIYYDLGREFGRNLQDLE
jgi:hypothetical protein